MAQSVRTLLDTVVQALPEVSNLGLLFFLLFFIFAALGVELFGRVGACYVDYLLIFMSKLIQWTRRTVAHRVKITLLLIGYMKSYMKNHL